MAKFSFCPSALAVPWLFVALVLWAAGVQSAAPPRNALGVEILGEEMSVTHFPAEGNRLVVWVAPGYGSHERAWSIAEAFAEGGVEVWHVDLADSLFLPKSTSTMRSLDGRYVAALIEEAHARTGKFVTLFSRSYGSLPVLRGARLWQLGQRAGGEEDPYLTGAILFSPELYSEIPALGLPPVFDPIVDATNIPLVVFQGGSRNNRWQLGELVERLGAGGAPVYTEVLPGVAGIFYEGDTALATLETWRTIAPKLIRITSLLEKTPTSLAAVELASSKPPVSMGLDAKLAPFKGNPDPLPLDLPNLKGGQARITDFMDKVTVVNFWATWCPPCVEEIPSLNRLRQRMQGKAFDLISVDYAEDRQQVVEFLGRVDVHFPVLLDENGAVSAKWGALVFPSTFVIGPDGKIVYGVNGAIQWDSDEVVAMLESLL